MAQRPRLFCPNCLELVSQAETGCRACGYDRPASGWPQDDLLSRTIEGKYRIVERLGEGGFGVVVRARQVRDGVDLGDVVLKFMHPHLASRPSLRRRFLNEARAARALSNPHVVKVFDFSFDERGIPYIVMEFLEGQMLSRLLRQGPLSPLRTLQIALQATEALHVCHAEGIVHRDLKPSNILLLPGRNADFVKLIDFGVAHLPDGTLSQTMLGTPRYMPPEQIRQEPLDQRADIFALGVVIFECLAGQPPIAAHSAAEYLQLNLDQPPRRLRELAPHLPEDLEGLLAKMMAKDRAARPSSMRDLEARLTAIGEAHGWLTSAPVASTIRARSPAGETGETQPPTVSADEAMTTPRGRAREPEMVTTLSPVVRSSPPIARRALSWVVLAGLLGGAGLVTILLSAQGPSSSSTPTAIGNGLVDPPAAAVVPPRAIADLGTLAERPSLEAGAARDASTQPDRAAATKLKAKRRRPLRPPPVRREGFDKVPGL